jgi:hypothetical protein
MSSPKTHPPRLGFRTLGLVLLSVCIAVMAFRWARWSLLGFWGDAGHYFRKTDLRPIIVHIWAALCLFFYSVESAKSRLSTGYRSMELGMEDAP